MDRKILIGAISIIVIVVAAVSIYWYYSNTQSNVVTLQYWDNFKGEQSGANAIDNTVAAFEAANPNIKVVVTHWDYDSYPAKLSSSFAAGTPPDIFVSDPGGTAEAYVKANQLTDLTSLLSENWAIQELPNDTRAGFTFNGRTYAVPYEVNIQGMIINKGLFDNFSIPVPAENEAWTWDQFLNVCQTFKAGGQQPLTVRATDPRQMADYMDWLIFRVVGNDRAIKTYDRVPGYHFTDPQFVQAYQYFADLVATQPFANGWQTMGQSEAILAMEHGDAAIDLWYSFSVNDMISAVPGIQLDVVRPPSFPNYNISDSWVVTDGGNGFAIPSGSQHKVEAMDFLRFYYQPANIVSYIQTSGYVLAANVTVPSGTYNAIDQKLVQMMHDSNETGIRWVSYTAPAFGDEYQTDNANVLLGLMTPLQACQDLENTAQQMYTAGTIP